MSTGPGATAYVTLDYMNGDRILDIVAVDPFNDTIKVLLGRGDGTFGSPILTDIAAGPTMVKAGFIDADSIADLVVATESSVVTLLGLGDGTFGSRVVVSDEAMTTIELSYINDDEHLDVIASDGQNSFAQVFLGRGDGAFSMPESHATGDIPGDFQLADVNRDNHIDIVTISRAGKAMAVLYSNGDGTFAAPVFVAINEYPSSFVLCDIGEDDIIDAVVGNSEARVVSVLRGNVDGTIGAPSVTLNGAPNTVAAGDLDGNGIVDLVASAGGNLSVLLGVGEGLFEAARDTEIGDGARNVQLGYVNDDDIVDAMALSREASSQRISVLLGRGDGTFTEGPSVPVPYNTQSFALSDFNIDGRADLVIGDPLENQVLVRLGVDDGTFGAAQPYVTNGMGNLAGPRLVLVDDFNDDGFPDIVTNHNNAIADTNFVSVLLNLEDGTFGSPMIRTVPGQGTGFHDTGDINMDGIADIVLANRNSHTVSTLIGGGDGTFAIGPDIQVGGSPTYVTLSDIDGDTMLDAVVDTLEGSAKAFFGSGDGSFGEVQSFLRGGGFTPTSVVDIDNDGRLDMAAPLLSFNQIRILRNNGGLGAQLASHAFAYESTYKQLTRTVDGLDHYTLFDIDPSNGNRLSATEIIGDVGGNDDLITRFDYIASGQTDTIEDPLHRVTDFDYDGLGRLIAVTVAKDTAKQATRIYEHDMGTVAGQAGLVTAMIDEQSRRTVYEYDVMNRLKKIIEPDPDGPLGPLQSPITRFDYDDAGNLTKVIDAQLNVTRYEYEKMNRLAKVVAPDPDGNGPLNAPTTRYVYDPAGNLKMTVDPLNLTSVAGFDVRNRTDTITDHEGGITTFKYDLNNNLISLTDPVQNPTIFTYDSRDRLVRERDPLGKIIKYTYDAADNLIAKTDRNGRVTEYEYDDVYRLETERWFDVAGTEVNTIAYAYDDNSNLDTIGDAFSALDFDYDERNRLEVVDNAGTPGVPNVVLTYAYDDASNVRSVIDTINGQPGATTSYDYDELDRLIMLTQSGPGTADKRVDFKYNPLGQYDQINRYRDLAGTQLVIGTSYAYDALNRLDVMRHESSGGTVNFFDLDYDDASRITRITDIDGVTNYGYDDRDQLTSATHNAAKLAAGYVDELYEYDANGNRIESHLHGTDYVTPEQSANRLQSDGVYEYEYDDEGNLILRTRISGTEADGSTIREFTWDHRNRLTSVIDKLPDETPTQEVRFTYDALDRRISKSVDRTPLDAVDAALTHFVYNREDVILDFVDEDGDGSMPLSRPQRYLHGPGIDQVLSQDVGADTELWHLSDHLGTVRDLVDSYGHVQNHILYDSFGVVVGQRNGAVVSRYGFTGRELDTDIGLYYHRARYYDSAAGRFVSEDPVRLLGGVNLFVYAINNPLTYVDAEGRAPNQAGATGPDTIATKLRNGSLPNSNETIGNAERYFYTDEYGWVDFRHFAEAAKRVRGGESPAITLTLGFFQEVVQWMTEWGDDYRSGFSPEDLPSNRAGVDFALFTLQSEYLVGGICGTLEGQFENWAARVGARELSSPYTGIADLPASDPSFRGGKGRGLSNPTSNKPSSKP